MICLDCRERVATTCSVCRKNAMWQGVMIGFGAATIAAVTIATLIGGCIR